MRVSAIRVLFFAAERGLELLMLQLRLLQALYQALQSS